MNVDKELLRPWAKHRPSLLSWIDANAKAECPSRSKTNLNLEDLHTRVDLLDVIVKPIWENIKGRDDEEIANAILLLIKNLLATPNKQDSIKLYQILFTDWYTHFQTWQTLATVMQSEGLLGERFVFDYFLFWAEEAPDEGAVDAALFILARTQIKPPLELAWKMATHSSMVVAAAALIAQQFEASEEHLILIAKSYGYSVRMHVLSMLKRVENPENKRWLLEEGYDSGADYHPCAFYAAVHGDLLGELRTNNCMSEQIFHYASSLVLMCEAVGGAASWKTIENYQDAPEALTLLFAHIERLDVVKQMLIPLMKILCALDYMDAKLNCDAEVQQVIAQKCRSFFSPPWVSESEVLDYLWWERPAPTVENLRDGELSQLNAVLDLAIVSDDDAKLTEIVNWATEYLCLDKDSAQRERRKLELLGVKMSGVCTGGIAGVNDANLGSVYGQVLLQISQALKGRKPMGKQLLLAALETDYPHLPKAAAEVLVSWKKEILPESVRFLINAQIGGK